MKYNFLSGGTGTPKLLLGFRKLIPDLDISVICNTGDDIIWNGLHISPDLDTVIYLFADRLDQDKFWGVKDETFNALSTLKSLMLQKNANTWFNVGDKDLGLHIYRSALKGSLSLSEVTQKICKTWNIKAKIAPMADTMVQSIIHTDAGKLPFQQFFVKHRFSPHVETVTFKKEVPEKIPLETLELLKKANRIIIGPSNPVTSIGPMLEIEPLKNEIRKQSDKVIAISPTIGNSAFSGPTTKLMTAVQLEPNSIGIATHYQDLISHIILDPKDVTFGKSIQDLGIEPIYHPIDLKTENQKIQLARFIMESF